MISPRFSQANIENVDKWIVQPVIHKSGHVVLKAQAWLVALDDEKCWNMEVA